MATRRIPDSTVLLPEGHLSALRADDGDSLAPALDWLDEGVFMCVGGPRARCVIDETSLVG